MIGRFVVRGLLACCLLFGAFLSNVVADDATHSMNLDKMDLDKLETIVRNMGYDTTRASDSSNFQITIPSNSITYHVVFSFSGDKEIVFLVINFVFTEADMKKMDLLGLLKANDLGSQFYSFHDYGEKKQLYLQSTMPADGVSAHSLRYAIDQLINRGNGTTELWDKSLWK